MESNLSKLHISDFLNIREYELVRNEWTKKIIAHKQTRRLQINEHIMLCFEDKRTIWYQIQEMIRIEKIHSSELLLEEIDAYSPLIPNGSEFKATMMIMYEDASTRKEWLTKLKNIEHTVWVAIGDHPPIYAIADEDLPRSDEEKTSAVHFLRFPLTESQCKDFKKGAQVSIGVDCKVITLDTIMLSDHLRKALLKDLL
ncbi:MAG: DUF3501 family protein [Methylacidiphilales bacterium]|nr:DUF3501 family protein [Candidatus Methylacidiphilales bacterium]